jgi:predicted DNA binding protein
MKDQGTLSKLLELFSSEDSLNKIEKVIKGARFIQKSMELLGIDQQVQEGQLISVAKKLMEAGAHVEGNLILEEQNVIDFNQQLAQNAKMSGVNRVVKL